MKSPSIQIKTYISSYIHISYGEGPPEKAVQARILKSIRAKDDSFPEGAVSGEVTYYPKPKISKEEISQICHRHRVIAKIAILDEDFYDETGFDDNDYTK